MYKLGPHAILNNGTVCQWAAVAPVVKSLNTAVLRAAHPTTVQIYRHYFANPQPLDDPTYTVNAILDGLSGYRADNLYIELWNEVHPTTAQMLAVTKALHAYGYKVAGGSYSTGDYTQEDFNRVHAAGCDAIAVHCYWGNQGFTQDHALRYRQFNRYGRPILITECGRDRVEGGKGGWHADGLTNDQYVAELVAYAKEISKDSYVLGATPFTSAPTPDWSNFEVDSITPQLMTALGGNVPPTYNVGPGVLAKMKTEGDSPATDEIYLYEGAPWSETVGQSGKVYRYVKSLNETLVYVPKA